MGHKAENWEKEKKLLCFDKRAEGGQLDDEKAT